MYCNITEGVIKGAMKKLTDEELGKAFNIWIKSYTSSEVDDALRPFLNDRIKAFVPGHQGWLKKARNGLFLSAAAVSKKAKVSRAAYSKYEDCEEKGSITLATLANAAKAMDCELVYAIRPKSKKYFSQTIWTKLLRQGLLHPWIKKCDQKRRAEGLAYVLNKLMNDSKFRREQGWSQQANK